MNIGVALGNLGFAIGRPIDGASHAALVYAIAGAAEELGFHSVWAGDHLALPRQPTTPYPYGGMLLDAETSLLEPFTVLAAIAGRTARVRLGLGVVVAPYRHPLVSAKMIATLDALSGGRAIVGVGTGWLPEEFAAVGASFASRGTSTDACLSYWERAFRDGGADGMTLLPRPVQQPRPPLWVGGNATAAMRRAVRWADGWDAPYADVSGLGAGLVRLRELCAREGRDPSTLGVSVRGIPCASLSAALVAEYAALGVTDIGVTLPLSSPGTAVGALEALAALVVV
ncbi:MAG TPA: TIGR03619 family F420-dependent LLM class oxidoreductase [Acidimicrobiales bacterium]|nr:TIGR03619 family F420-dependent LLM class oxidoreductase [Acidimicrobiales bacterium]